MAERTPEARRERSEAPQADREADVGNREIGRAQQRGGALQPACQQVGMRGFAERAAELAAEVRAREPGRVSHVVHGEALEVARVREVAGAQEVARGRHEGESHAQRRPAGNPELIAPGARPPRPRTIPTLANEDYVDLGVLEHFAKNLTEPRLARSPAG
jgi:hypothetical protein